MPGQEFTDAIDGMVANTLKYTAQVGFRIEATELRGV
jgi:hypothetical protein